MLPGALVATLLGARSTRTLGITKGAAAMKWREIDLPALSTLVSTGAAQPLAREQWPTCAQESTGFTGAWLSPSAGTVPESTAALCISNVQAHLDVERSASHSPALRYYRYLYIKMNDGRVFQSGPFKDLEYERHRNERPMWLTSPST
jgi:hypothetical protein